GRKAREKDEDDPLKSFGRASKKPSNNLPALALGKPGAGAGAGAGAEGDVTGGEDNGGGNAVSEAAALSAAAAAEELVRKLRDPPLRSLFKEQSARGGRFFWTPEQCPRELVVLVVDGVRQA
ncbi:unnamed protein product, partial [Laminaria digitata]